MGTFRWFCLQRWVVAKVMKFSLTTNTRDHIFLVVISVTADARDWGIFQLSRILPRHLFLFIRLFLHGKSGSSCNGIFVFQVIFIVRVVLSLFLILFVKRCFVAFGQWRRLPFATNRRIFLLIGSRNARFHFVRAHVFQRFRFHLRGDYRFFLFFLSDVFFFFVIFKRR